MPPLRNPKRERFCLEVLVDDNASAAYRRAGYSSRATTSTRRRAHELKAKSDIAARIAELRAARAERTETEAEWIIRSTKEVVDRCLQRAPVLVRRGKEMVQLTDEEGRTVWQFDAQGALGGLNLIGKANGLFAKPIVNVNVDLDTLSDAQLEHLAAGGSIDKLPR